MKLKTTLRTAKVVAVSLAIGFGTTACIRDYTSDYVYAVSNSSGQVSAYGVDYQTGVLTQISDSPFATNLTNPSTIVAGHSGKTVYVIGGSQDASLEVMAVGSDGKLYGEATPDLPNNDTSPTAAAVDSTGTYLYVTFSYQPGYSTASPGPGGVVIFPIKPDGTLGTPSEVNVGNQPVAIAVSPPTCTSTPAIPSSVSGLTSPNCIILGSNSPANNGYTNTFVYVVDQEQAAAKPTILGFVQNPSNGNLVPITANVNSLGGYNAGVLPSSIAIDPTGKYVYITDELQNEVIGYQIDNSTTGELVGLVTSPYPSGQYPDGITIDPRGKYVYVTNFDSQTVSSYSLNLSTGALGATAGSNFAVQTGPTCVTVDPALGLYIYTSNYLDASLSGGQLNPDTGALSAVPTVFFPSQAQPICLTSVPNGPNAVQETQP
jgi:6-phosphogluconolactonase (cycloisomerase 2 family)